MCKMSGTISGYKGNSVSVLYVQFHRWNTHRKHQHWISRQISSASTIPDITLLEWGKLSDYDLSDKTEQKHRFCVTFVTHSIREVHIICDIFYVTSLEWFVMLFFLFFHLCADVMLNEACDQMTGLCHDDSQSTFVIPAWGDESAAAQGDGTWQQ